MANTAVKDVSSLFLNQAVPAAGKAAAGSGEFHKVWSSQMNKGASNSAADNSNSQNQSKISGQNKDSIREKAPMQKDDEKQPVASSEAAGQEEAVSAGSDAPGAEQTAGTNAEEHEAGAGELQEALDSPEMPGQVKTVLSDGEADAADTAEEIAGVTQEQLLAMEILGTAAAKLMEQIADAFGITVEELQTAMDGLEMEQADLLDPSKLGNLLLELGGAQDEYALITDGALYDNYRMVMEQQKQMLQESADALETDPKQLPELLKDSIQALQKPEAEAPDEMAADRMTVLKEDAAAATEETVSMNSGMPAETVEDGQAEAKQDTGAHGQSERQPESRDNQVNVFVQNVRVEQSLQGLRQAQEISQDSPWSADTRQIMDQILDYMKLSLNADTTSLEMQLHPASLGTLHIQIASKGGIVTANFITENEAVKAALESQMLQLREHFEEQGVKVEAIEVTVQTHEFEQNLEQGRGRSQQEGEKRSRSRRFRMNRVSVMSAAESDDAAAADRIAADGSTVSYTA